MEPIIEIEKADPDRLARGIGIMEAGGISQITPRHWYVRSAGSYHGWDVEMEDDGKLKCGCPDFVQRHQLCKHILAVWLKVRSDSRDEPGAVTTPSRASGSGTG